MKLFKNGVGRPSNDIKKKRKIFVVSAIVGCTALVITTGYLTFSLINSNNVAAKMKPNPHCKLPYSRSNCNSIMGYKANKNVKKIQQLLQKAKSSYFISVPNGYYGPVTETGIQKFQKKFMGYTKKTKGYGIVGVDTLERLVIEAKKKKASTNYYKIKYELGKGSGTLDSTEVKDGYNYQIILSGIDTALANSSSISRDGYTFNGWKSDVAINGKNTFSLGETVNISSIKNGTLITMTAQWKKNSSGSTPTTESLKTDWDTCVTKASGWTTSAYGPNCSGTYCTGMPKCPVRQADGSFKGKSCSKNDYKYTDPAAPEYGELWIIGVDTRNLNSKFPCGTIVELTPSGSGCGFKIFGKVYKSIRGIILDSGDATLKWFDIMFPSEQDAKPANFNQAKANYKVLRNGWNG